MKAIRAPPAIPPSTDAPMPVSELRLQSRTAIGDVCDTKALVGSQQVLQSLRQQSTYRYLERTGRTVQISASCRAGMQIDSVAADAHSVGKGIGPISAATRFHAYMRLQDM